MPLRHTASREPEKDDIAYSQMGPSLGPTRINLFTNTFSWGTTNSGLQTWPGFSVWINHLHLKRRLWLRHYLPKCSFLQLVLSPLWKTTTRWPDGYSPTRTGVDTTLWGSLSRRHCLRHSTRFPTCLESSTSSTPVTLQPAFTTPQTNHQHPHVFTASRTF